MSSFGEPAADRWEVCDERILACSGFKTTYFLRASRSRHRYFAIRSCIHILLIPRESTYCIFVRFILFPLCYLLHSIFGIVRNNLAIRAWQATHQKAGNYLNDWSRMEKTYLRSCIGSISSWFFPAHTYVRDTYSYVLA